MLVHLPRLEGWGQAPPVKNGPALSGYGAVAMNAALTASLAQLPVQLRQSLTWDRGKELAGHAQFALDTGTKVFFADPHSPWQRPTNENTNGLLRQYFPKGTDLSRWSADDLEAVALALNNRPRKVLGEPDLGPRQRTRWACPVRVGHRHESLLRRPALTLAAAHQREHQRTAASVLSERNRPVPVVSRRPRSGRPCAQQQAPQGPRMEDPGRSLCRTTTLA